MSAPYLRPPRVARVALCAALALGLVVAGAACGKKGPPLAPLIRVPAPVGDFSARRLGDTVYMRFTVPGRNQDNSTPANLSRVEVYGYTGKPASDDDILQYGTLVATVPVRPPPREDEDLTRKPKDRGTPDNGREQARAAEERGPGFDQGAVVTVTEKLTPAVVQPVVVKRRTRAKPTQEVPAPALLAVATFDDIPSRVYMAVGVNGKGRRGPVSRHVVVPVIALPQPPSGLRLTYTEKQWTLQWTPPPGAPSAPAAKADAGYLRGRPIVPITAPGWYYDVFEVPAPRAAAPGPASAAPAAPPELPRVEQPAALNPKPLAAPTFTDSRIEFGVERCYAVRTINVFGQMQEESEPSEPACVTPRDTFPPAPPQALIAVAGTGVVSLSWEPNSEPDLAGYVVLRGDASGGALQPLTAAPIQATTFEDKTAKPGERYVYAVAAVDRATPPNVSKESNRIEETAR